MSAINQVLVLAKAIEDEGKQPSLALIKARLTPSLPMPELIKGLQTYKTLSEEQKQALSHEQPARITTKKIQKTQEQRLDHLEQLISQLQTENHSLKKRLEKLEQGSN